jgi:hypothetical protein
MTDTKNSANPLSRIPAKVRLTIYVVATLALLAIAAWQAADGDWLKAIGLFASSLVTLTAGSNVRSP